jgi:hypothetical protein
MYFQRYDRKWGESSLFDWNMLSIHPMAEKQSTLEGIQQDCLTIQ